MEQALANKAAQAAANAEKLKKYVRVGFEGALLSYKQLPRTRLTPSNVNRVFNCDVEFLVDEEGNILLPKDWAVACAPPPAVYFIKEKAWAMLEADPMEEDEYRGTTVVVVDNVPAQVSEGALVAWLNCGLDDDDPDLAVAKQQLEWLRDRLSSVERQVKDLPTTRLSRGVGGAKEELELKKLKSKVLGLQKGELTADIKLLQGKFDQLRMYRESLATPSFTLALVDTKLPLNLNVWEAKFGNSPKGARFAYIACHKKDWANIALAVHGRTGAPMVGVGTLAALTEEHVQVNMRMVHVSRRRHGLGMYIHPDERGYYSGQWVRGLRCGVGTSLTHMGRYQGGWVGGEVCGVGSMVYAAGDTVRGVWGRPTHHTTLSLLGGEEYMDGVPHGRASCAFSDGSTYDGEWWNGVPKGVGRYVGAGGVVMEGDFGAWGALDGGYGSVSVGERTRLGLWKGGQLNGGGVELDGGVGGGGDYTGEFRQGERHGWGELSTHEGGVLGGGLYKGWWRQGYRWGQGTLNFGHLNRTVSGAAAKAAAIRAAQNQRVKLSAEGGISPGATAASHVDEGLLGDAQARVAARRAAAAAAEEGKEAGAGGAGGAGGGRGVIGGGFVAEATEEEIAQAAAAAGQGGSVGGGGKRPFFASGFEFAQAGGVEGGGGGGGGLESHEEAMKTLVYAGDYEVHSRWVGGLPWAGGVFTTRHSRIEPNKHTRVPTISGRWKTAPGGLADMDLVEEALRVRREAASAASRKASLGRRMVKEAQNLKEYSLAWRHAEGQVPGLKARNRESKGDIDGVRESVKKVGTKFDDKGEWDQDDMEVADEDIMQMLELEESEEVQKVLPPSEVREGYVI